MEIDIPDLLRALGVDDGQNDSGGWFVQGEVETIIRISMTKLRPPILGTQEFLRSYIAVDLGLGKLGIPFSRATLLKKASAREKTYDSVYKRMQNVLGARVAPMGGNIANLAVKFSGAGAERSVAVLQNFQRACRSSVTAEQGDRLVEQQYNTSKYHAAAFCVASVQDKFKLDRGAVAETVKLRKKELDEICADMVAKCGLRGLEHVARAFRLECPGSADEIRAARAAGGAAGTKGRGKRTPSPRQREGRREGAGRGGGGAVDRDGEGVPPATAATTRLDGDGSPASPYQSDRPATGRGAETHLDFVEAGRIPAAHHTVDPEAPLKLLLKRLRTLESKSYEDWCLQTLGIEEGRQSGAIA